MPMRIDESWEYFVPSDAMTHAMPDAESEWYATNRCDHAHCPLGCAKPQPAIHSGGKLLCMRCLVLSGLESEMVPCTPDACED